MEIFYNSNVIYLKILVDIVLLNHL